MTKDIWHITNQDENTTDMPEKENLVVLIGHWTSCLWYGGETPEPIFWKNVKKWCYLDDLLALETELDRTHKALDKAKNRLQELKDIIACPPDVSYETGVSMYADGVLQEITALEQKDVK